MLAKISKIARFILLLLIFSIGLLYIVFKSQPVQTWLVQKATTYLSQQMGTKIRVGAVDIDFFKTAVLQNVYIEDQHQDTLFYFRNIKADYKDFDNLKRIVSFNEVTIEGAKVLFGEHNGDSVGNFEFFIDYFNSGGPRDPNKPKLIWTVYSKRVNVINTRFDYFSRNGETPDFMDFNYNDMSYRNINGILNDFYLVDDSMHFHSEHFEFREKCGLVVTELSADAKIHEGGIELNDMLLQTPYSLIGNQFILVSKDWKDYNDFNNNIFMKANFKDAKIDAIDLGFFSNYLKEYKTAIFATGYAEGYVKKMKGRNIKLKLFDKTTYEGDWSLTGLPNIDNTLMVFDVNHFVTNYKDLNTISFGNIPSNMSTLGTIGYKGNFSGYYNDFVTFGAITTSLGDFDADMNLKYKDGLETATYSGKLKTAYFKLKTFLPQSPFDNAAFDMKIEGVGMNAEKYMLNVEGDISQLGFRNYTYQNIKAKGKISKNLFSGIAEIRDPHLNLDFDGEFNSGGNIPEAIFNAKIFNADLGSLGFDTTEQNVKGIFMLDFKGKNLDDAVGSITGTDIKVFRNNTTVDIPSIQLSSNYISSQQKELKLSSEFADIQIEGKYTLSKIDISLLHMLHQLIPAYFNKPKENLPNEDFKFSIDLKEPDKLTTLYAPNITLMPCKANGFYQSANQYITFKTSNEKITYDDYEINNLAINAYKLDNTLLKIDVTASNFTNNSSIKTQDIVINSSVYDNIINFKLNVQDTGYALALDAGGRVMFGKDSIELQILESNIDLEKDQWKLQKMASLLFTNDKFELKDFTLLNGNQALNIVGEYGTSSANQLNIMVNDFGLASINKILKDKNIPLLGGVTKGQLTYKIIESKPVLTSDLNIINLVVGKDTIGDLFVVSKSTANPVIQDVSIKVVGGVLDSLLVKGIVDFKSKSNNLDLKITIPPSEIKVFQPFLIDLVSNMQGRFYTNNLELKGSFEHPMLSGDIHIDEANLLIDYLNIPIAFDAVITTSQNAFTINKFDVSDNRGSKGIVQGSIRHNDFSNFYLDLSITKFNNFHVLNTTSVNNSVYYGTAYATGNAYFRGPFDDLDIKIDARTMPGTYFYLPISDGDASGFPAYVHFKTAKKNSRRGNDDFPIRSLIMDIEATTDANIDIIFDESLGDKISGNGRGNIKMEMTKSADFYMFGTYTVAKGKYLFTAFDLYNKPFFVRPGGTISWFGDPLNAQLNLVAYNTEKTTSSPLLAAVTLNSNVSVPNITAESELYIRGNLFTPDISFGLNFPKLQSEVPSNLTVQLSSIIGRIRADKEEVSRQVFSLLIMKQFITPNFAQGNAGLSNAGGQALSSAGSDLLSAQLSNWLNKIDPNWKVNVIYKNGNFYLPAEYGLALSSKFFNDKLIFDGSYSNLSNRPNINIEYKITKKGNLRVKAYTRSNINSVSTTVLNTPINTTGVGLVYTKEFNRIRKKKKAKDSATKVEQ
ncbi:MAG: translocation/assembly module TamB domain-containing protein [bacterium]|nr:translocation/assembly module TamB domain-containing protein [bacterium]